MDEIVTALRAEQAALAALVDPLDRDGLATPSRCEGWSVADVLLHLAQTNELALASVRGELSTAIEAGPRVEGAGSIDDWAGRVVEAERSDDLEGIRARWHESARAQADAFADCDPRARLQWVVGELAARTLATTRLSETWIHSVDIAHGLGVEHPPTDRLWHVARLAHRTLPYACASAGEQLSGPVTFELRSPGGDTWTFGDEPATTAITGDAVELCEVAGQRRDASAASLTGDGPDVDVVLRLVRTFA